MSILLAPAPAPNSNPRDSWPDWTDRDRWQVADLPEFLLPQADDVEPFAPTLEQEARDLGYRLARDGENPRTPAWTPGQTHEERWQFQLGVIEGQRDRATIEKAARQAGYSVGLISDISEPPSVWYSAWEQAAYREGWAAGQADDDRDTEAWIASERLQRLEDAFTAPIDDRDMYRVGGTS
jgi:hypothetical protein